MKGKQVDSSGEKDKLSIDTKQQDTQPLSIAHIKI